MQQAITTAAGEQRVIDVSARIKCARRAPCERSHSISNLDSGRPEMIFRDGTISIYSRLVITLRSTS